LDLHVQLGQILDQLNKAFNFPGNIIHKLDVIAPAWKIFARTSTSQWINTNSQHLIDKNTEQTGNQEQKEKKGSHKDTKNLPNTLTWVFVFGNHKGGNVKLKNTGLEIPAHGGSAYAFLAQREMHTVAEDLDGDRASLVSFTHKDLLSIPANAINFNLDPWLTYNIEKQGKKTTFNFESQFTMLPRQKLTYVLQQTKEYHNYINNKKKQIN